MAIALGGVGADDGYRAVEYHGCSVAGCWEQCVLGRRPIARGGRSCVDAFRCQIDVGSIGPDGLEFEAGRQIPLRAQRAT